MEANYSQIRKGRSNEKWEIPVEICISKSDILEFQEILDDAFIEKLQEDIMPIKDPYGHNRAVFHAQTYNPIATYLHDFMNQYESRLEMMMYNNFAHYNYFAFSALGCDVHNGKPVGPILPKRIEEPLFWLFHQFGYIQAQESVYLPNPDLVIQEMKTKVREKEKESVLKRFCNYFGI